MAPSTVLPTHIKVAQRFAANIAARQQMDPSVLRGAKGMLEEMKAAEVAVHRALQYGRTVNHEASLSWMVDQVEELHGAVEGLAKGMHESLEYILREDL